MRQLRKSSRFKEKIVAFLAYVSQSEYNAAIDKRGDCFRTKAMLIAAIGIILFVKMCFEVKVWLYWIII